MSWTRPEQPSQRRAPVRAIATALLLGATMLGAVADPDADARPRGPGTSAFPGRNGALAFTGSQAGGLNIFRMEDDGSGTRRLSDGDQDNLPAWSADATQVLFTSSRDGGNSEIYRMNASGTSELRMTNSGGLDTDAAWFPGDGAFVFSSTREGSADLWVHNLTETLAPDGGPVQLTTNPASDVQPVVSPDGKRIAFASHRDGDFEIYVIWANAPEGPTNKAVRLTTNTAVNGDPDWSPSGQQIAFTTRRDGNDEIYVMNADGTRQRNLTQNPRTDRHPSWSPSGKQIAFERDGIDVFRDIFRMRADGTRQVNLTESTDAVEADPNWQPRPD